MKKNSINQLLRLLFLISISFFSTIFVFSHAKADEYTGCCITDTSKNYHPSVCQKSKKQSECSAYYFVFNDNDCTGSLSSPYCSEGDKGCCIKDKNKNETSNCVKDTTNGTCLDSGYTNPNFVGGDTNCTAASLYCGGSASSSSASSTSGSSCSSKYSGAKCLDSSYCGEQAATNEDCTGSQVCCQKNICEYYSGTCSSGTTCTNGSPWGSTWDTACGKWNNSSSSYSCCDSSSGASTESGESDTSSSSSSSGSSTSSSSTTCSKSPSEGLSGGLKTYSGSLVPCGRQCDDSSTTVDESKSCTLCHMLIMLSRFYNLMTALLIIVAFLALTIAGVLYIVSGASPGLKSTAKGLVTKTLSGFALFLLSWLIVYTILTVIAAKSSNFKTGSGKWYEFTCNTSSIFDTGATSTGSSSGSGSSSSSSTTSTSGGGTCGGMKTSVSNQCALASGDLTSLLSCISSNGGTGEVYSVTSSKVGGDLSASKSCCGNESCVHATYSCHYGCKMTDQGYSHGADIATNGWSDSQLCALADIVQSKCGGGKIWGPKNMSCSGGGQIIYQSGHGTHLHISTKTCNH